MEITGRMVQINGPAELDLQTTEVLVEGRAGEHLQRDFVIYLERAMVVEGEKRTPANDFFATHSIMGGSSPFSPGRLLEVSLRKAAVKAVDGKNISHYYGPDIRNWTATAIAIRFGPEIWEELSKIESITGQRNNLSKENLLECIHRVRKDYFLDSKPKDETLRMFMDLANG